MVSKVINVAASAQSPAVLILVVVEYGLEVTNFLTQKRICLNPCCRGIWSRREHTTTHLTTIISLNPCCRGIWS